MTVLKQFFYTASLVFAFLSLTRCEYSKVHEAQNYVPRAKRDFFIVQKRLNDPEGCIEQCISDETEEASVATTDNTHRLIGIGMQDAKIHKHRMLLDTDDEILEQIHELAVSNMGPLFEDLCEISRTADECLRKCPKSQLRDITIADHNGATLYCEPTKNWPSFTEYYVATDCINRTILSKVCDGKCGPEQTVSTATRLQLHKSLVRHDVDAKMNTQAAESACKSITCHTECYQSIMEEHCGHKAFDMYKRIYNLASQSALDILKIMNVIDEDIEACQQYYRKS